METFQTCWEHTVKQYADTVAYYTVHNVAVTYQALALQARAIQEQFSEHHLVYIDGRLIDWLTQAVAAWCAGKTVLFFDGQLEQPRLCIDGLEIKDAHAIFFTSGTTGRPKAIIRTTDFALFEANAYMLDVQLPPNSIAVSYVFPWFGAMTKHTLGLLLNGIPQYFHMPEKLPEHTKSLLYCTPSQLTLPILKKAPHQWDAVSLTGEPLNTVHISHLKACLKPEGWVLDAFGQTECGVIARRKQFKNSLNQLSQNFCGEILPGKKVFVNDNHALSIQLPNKKIIHMDDLGSTHQKQLTLYGRASIQRKVRGQWVNVSPLLVLCRTHKDIHHIELDASQNKLILYVVAGPTLTAYTLHAWLSERLLNIHLLPQLIMSTRQDQTEQLGRTGKFVLSKKEQSINVLMPEGIQILAESILTASTQKNSRDLFKTRSFEEQGLSSLDIMELVQILEKRTGHQGLKGNILKTDTPLDVYQYLQAQNSPHIIKEVFNDSDTLQIICLGYPLSVIHKQFEGQAQLIHSDLIEVQTTPFTITELAQKLLQQGESVFRQTKKRWIAAYSIHALLAIALCERLEKNNISVDGIFLLDPPHNKRRRTLRRKYIFLKTRQIILNKLIKYKHYQNTARYCYELRKIAIARHPKITLKTTVLRVHTDQNNIHTPWLSQSTPQENIILSNIHHLALIKTKQGIDSWLPCMKHFFNLPKY